MRSLFSAGLEIINHRKLAVMREKPFFRSILEVPGTVFMLPFVRKFSRSAERITNLDEAIEFSFSYKDSDISIAPSQVREEIRELLALVERLRPKVVLEIGTERGGTLFLFTRVADPRARIISIDLPRGLYGGGYPVSKVPLYKAFAKERQRLSLIRGDSHDQGVSRRIREVLGGRAVDFLFIDGDHTFEGVKKDFEMYSPMVGRGGIVVFHDILPHPAELRCRVNEFWDATKREYRHTEIVKDSNQGWAGIGVLYL